MISFAYTFGIRKLRLDSPFANVDFAIIYFILIITFNFNC